MKEKAGKVLYLLLLLSAGVCLMIGAVINIKKHSGYLVIAGGFAIGIGMVTLAVKGLMKNLRGN